LEIRVRPGAIGDADARAALVAALVDCGSPGVVEEGASLVAYVPEATAPPRFRDALAEADQAAQVDVSPYIAEDWTRRWREGVRAHEVGPLRVAPPWLADAGDAARTVVIDPGMAFGTGEHATTRGMLRLLSRVVRPDDFVADLGTGSAILAIAAAKLGATRVAAIELDADAISNAQANVDVNGVERSVCVLWGDARAILPLVAPVRIITANIVSSTIVELLPIMREALDRDGCAILGGIMVDERAGMRDILSAEGWRVDADDVEDEWWAAIVTRQ
jgi:ribosomal protein L11 methyltransferase